MHNNIFLTHHCTLHLCVGCSACYTVLSLVTYIYDFVTVCVLQQAQEICDTSLGVHSIQFDGTHSGKTFSQITLHAEYKNRYIY